MFWLALAFDFGAVALVAAFVWRKWIEPWRQLETLLEAIAQQRPLRTFLLSGTRRVRGIGLALEKLALDYRHLSEQINEGDFSFQTVLATMHDGLMVVDESTRIRLTNPELRRLFQLEENSTATVIEALADAPLDRLVRAALASGEPGRELMKSPPRRNIPARELEVNAVPIKDADGRSKGAVVLFHDITQLRQLEEMRRDFVANVSHELRTPLSIFRGYIEALLDDPKMPPRELLRILETMERHSDRLTALVEDLLSLAKLEAPEPHLDLADIRLGAFLHEVSRDWETKLATKKLTLAIDAPSELPMLRADEVRLQEIIYNLLDNAVKYSHDGGSITMRGEQRRDSLVLSISDEGIGVAGRDLDRIFERFYRADKARSRELGGTGLGLSIVKHIAQLHGGTVEVESQPGRGTTLRVLFPLKPVARAEEEFTEM